LRRDFLHMGGKAPAKGGRGVSLHAEIVGELENFKRGTSMRFEKNSILIHEGTILGSGLIPCPLTGAAVKVKLLQRTTGEQREIRRVLP
jgi:hypothetical protein